MITKSTLKVLVAGGGVLATWFAVGSNHSAPLTSATREDQRPAVTRETTADELNAQASKLREHVTANQFRPSTRNPFRFGAAKPSTSNGHRAGPSSTGSTMSAPAAPLAPPAPTFTLAGIAERNTPEGRKRTAVISGEGQLYLVTEGEVVAGRYTVARIDPEAVLLRDPSGAEINLILH